MYPNLFLRTYRKTKYDRKVFVAMDFHPDYDVRWTNVFAPAISQLAYEGEPLVPWRADLSKTGDSVITEIVDGISSALLILCDVSVVGFDHQKKRAFRNENVMYEVGLAHACRHSTDVLLVKDDGYPLLFDVRSIPHLRVDFKSETTAKQLIGRALQDRLDERSRLIDIRAEIIMNSLSKFERMSLLHYAGLLNEPDWYVKTWKTYRSGYVMRLLDKELLIFEPVVNDPDHYLLTPLGHDVARLLVDPET